MYTQAVVGQAILTGKVVDESGAPIPGARVSVTRADSAPLETSSNPTGAFRIALPAPGTYVVAVDHLGFFRLQNHQVRVTESGAEITLVLNPQREIFQSVDVGAEPSRIDPEDTSANRRLSGTEINNIPYPGTHSLRNAMKLTPGTIQDNGGGVHVHGSAENQIRYTLNGFDITDPVTGRYSTLLAVEGVREMELISSRASPEYGRGSGGTLAIRSESGTDRFHFTATNFVPGIDTHHGLHFGHWTPRGGISGPLKPGRAWFSNSIYGDYNPTYHPGLPAGQDVSTYVALGDLMHIQVNLTPADILYADGLANIEHENRNGLSVLDPVETTTRYRATQWLGTVKESHSWKDGTLLEAGVASLETYHRRAPQGDQPYVFSVFGRRGNYYVNSAETGTRQQAFVNFYPKSFQLWGRHQFQMGGDAQHLSYTGDFQRTLYDYVNLQGALVTETRYYGPGDFLQRNVLQSAFFNDQWRPVDRLTLNLGVRQDWDGVVGQSVWGPRMALAWSPFPNSRTKISGGYAIFHDPTNLSMLTRPHDQLAVTFPVSQAGLPYTTQYLLGPRMRLPISTNWSAGAEHEFGKHIFGQFEFLRKRGRDGFVYTLEPGSSTINLPDLTPDPVLQSVNELRNLRRDTYDEYSFTLRQSFGDQYEWFASYVRSRAASNAVLDIRIDQPYIVQENNGRMPWDSPNRFLSWGYLPLPLQKGHRWAFAYMAEWRTGFPFPVVTENGTVVGPVDSHRYPDNFELNLHIERRFELYGRRFAIRLGVNNITDSMNPSAVYNVIGSPNYLQFAGNEGRHVVVRFRFFGHGAG
jgi:hypothetical protein